MPLEEVPFSCFVRGEDSHFISLPIFRVQHGDAGEEVDVVLAELRLEAVVVGRPRQEGKRPVEAAGRRVVLRAQAEMPLAADQGVVTSVLEEFRESGHVMADFMLRHGLDATAV